jgi:hypothetical protein
VIAAQSDVCRIAGTAAARGYLAEQIVPPEQLPAQRVFRLIAQSLAVPVASLIKATIIYTFILGMNTVHCNENQV